MVIYCLPDEVSESQSLFRTKALGFRTEATWTDYWIDNNTYGIRIIMESNVRVNKRMSHVFYGKQNIRAIEIRAKEIRANEILASGGIP